MPMQSILFDIYKWTPEQAIAFMKRHKYHYLKLYESARFHRFRVVPPNKRYIYRTKNIGKGIKIILYYDPLIQVTKRLLRVSTYLAFRASVNNFLQKYGNHFISSITVCRRPLPSLVDKIANIATIRTI